MAGLGLTSLETHCLLALSGAGGGDLVDGHLSSSDNVVEDAVQVYPTFRHRSLDGREVHRRGEFHVSDRRQVFPNVW